jgi:predicted metal-dependent phosphotriesterase family hydrolase
VNAVETVLGPRDGERFQVVDAHAHLWIAGAAAGQPELADEELALAELRDAGTSGTSALIDCQPGRCGRDGRVLRRLMERSGVALIASTGFHMRAWYEPGTGIWERPGAALELFLGELTDGLEEEPRARAGVIKCAWTGESGAERELIAAAIEAARSADTGLVVHTERGARVEELCELVLAAGVAPARVQLSHVDKRPDTELHLEMARAGFVLGYDTFLRPKYRPEENVWRLLRAILAAGLWRHVTLGLDLVEPTAWRTRGGPGLRTLARLVTRLRREGASEVALRALAGGNALGLLTGKHVQVPA